MKHVEVKFEAVGRSLTLLRSSANLEYFKINGFTINPHIVQRQMKQNFGGMGLDDAVHQDSYYDQRQAHPHIP